MLEYTSGCGTTSHVLLQSATQPRAQQFVRFCISCIYNCVWLTVVVTLTGVMPTVAGVPGCSKLDHIKLYSLKLF